VADSSSINSWNMKMADIRSSVVVHAGSRDRYQVALALHEAGLLEKLVTDIYFPLDKPWFMRSFGRYLPIELLKKRYCSDLPSDKVCSSAKALAVIAANRMSPKLNLHPISDAILGRCARKLARWANATILSYSTYASEALKVIPQQQQHENAKLLFQMHPHPASAQRIIQEELHLIPAAKKSLIREHEMSIHPRIYRKLLKEPMMAGAILVASTFCRHTMEENGVAAERIHLTPYGIDCSRFPLEARCLTHSTPLRLVFLGSIIQRKGIAYLFEAMKLVIDKPVELVLCGHIAPDRDLLRRYNDCAIKVKLGLTHEKVLQELQTADMFVFPSLLEGFAHVILEAMSCGLPVITTPHTCGPDVVEEGEHGFIIPIRDPIAIADRILWALSNRKRLTEMGQQAAVRAREFTWERFRKQVAQVYNTVSRQTMRRNLSDMALP
jgi:glycosyltransferase involved in cell wall biosynthesis